MKTDNGPPWDSNNFEHYLSNKYHAWALYNIVATQ